MYTHSSCANIRPGKSRENAIEKCLTDVIREKKSVMSENGCASDVFRGDEVNPQN